MCSSSALDEQFIKFKTKWKGKRNPQTSYWRRASKIKQLQARDFSSLSSALSFLQL